MDTQIIEEVEVQNGKVISVGKIVTEVVDRKLSEEAEEENGIGTKGTEIEVVAVNKKNGVEVTEIEKNDVVDCDLVEVTF